MRRIILTITAVAAILLVATVSSKTRKASKTRHTARTSQIIAPAPAQSEEPQEWALVNVAAACLRTEPSHSASLETQASYGTPAKVLSRQGEWYQLELPDGYKAWMIGTSLVDLTDGQMKHWRNAPRVIVTQPRPAAAYSDSINISNGNVAFDIVLGSIFEGKVNPGSDFTEITLPDGRKGFVKSADIADFREWSQRKPDIETIMNTARSMMGVTYLWGGTTPKAVDCSGFTKLAYASAGLILPRNASQQAVAGLTLDPNDKDSLLQGDLLFFGSADGKKVTHVALYDGFTRYLHASGRVYESSFKPGHPSYLPRKVIGACRILSVPEPKDITPYSAHPWYFPQS